MSYDNTYHEQRITIKTLANSLGVPLTGRTRIQGGKTRQTVIPVGEVRLNVVARLLGRYAHVNKTAMRDVDAMLVLAGKTYAGVHGPVLREAARFIREAQDLRADAVDTFVAAEGGSATARWAAIERVAELLAMARQYQAAAEELQALYEANPVAAAAYVSKLNLGTVQALRALLMRRLSTN